MTRTASTGWTDERIAPVCTANEEMRLLYGQPRHVGEKDESRPIDDTQLPGCRSEARTEALPMVVRANDYRATGLAPNFGRDPPPLCARHDD